MGFSVKTWLDRVTDSPNRRLLTPVDGQANTFDVTRSEGMIHTEGDALNATNLNDLEQRILAAFNALGISTSTQSITIGDKFIQWGKSAPTLGPSGDTTLIFPTPFANADYRIFITPMYSNSSLTEYTIANPTKSQIDIWFGNGTPFANKTQGYHWFVIGTK